MKKLLLTLSAVAICSSAAFAQETISLKDATDIQGTYVALQAQQVSTTSRSSLLNLVLIHSHLPATQQQAARCLHITPAITPHSVYIRITE